MRLNAAGSIHTWIAYGIKSGEPTTVDDRTFDPAHHVNKDPAEIAYQKARGKAAKEGKVEVAGEGGAATETTAPVKKGTKGKK